MPRPVLGKGDGAGQDQCLYDAVYGAGHHKQSGCADDPLYDGEHLPESGMRSGDGRAGEHPSLWLPGCRAGMDRCRSGAENERAPGYRCAGACLPQYGEYQEQAASGEAVCQDRQNPLGILPEDYGRWAECERGYLYGWRQGIYFLSL